MSHTVLLYTKECYGIHEGWGIANQTKKKPMWDDERW